MRSEAPVPTVGQVVAVVDAQLGSGRLRWLRFLGAVDVTWQRAQSCEVAVLAAFHGYHAESGLGPVVSPVPPRSRDGRRLHAHHNPLEPEAVKLVHRIRDREDRNEALGELAEACIDIYPARAEQIARSIRDKDLRAELLEDIAAVRASTDPVRAERTARGIREAGTRAWTLAQIAKECAGRDRARAERLLADAEHLLESTGRGARADILAMIAGAYASIDPARAQQIFKLAAQDTQSMHPTAQDWALARIVTPLGSFRPSRCRAGRPFHPPTAWAVDRADGRGQSMGPFRPWPC